MPRPSTISEGSMTRIDLSNRTFCSLLDESHTGTIEQDFFVYNKESYGIFLVIFLKEAYNNCKQVWSAHIWLKFAGW